MSFPRFCGGKVTGIVKILPKNAYELRIDDLFTCFTDLDSFDDQELLVFAETVMVNLRFYNRMAQVVAELLIISYAVMAFLGVPLKHELCGGMKTEVNVLINLLCHPVFQNRLHGQLIAINLILLLEFVYERLSHLFLLELGLHDLLEGGVLNRFLVA